tara:strand:+ start:11449 stop:11997 length:549 start_codon:yes stop_codon:yes gene_type:complete
MKFETFEIDGPVICKPNIIKDNRGFFAEVFRKDLLENFTKQKLKFCQINKSVSKMGILRGLHFQVYPYAQTKLVSVTNGEIIDIIIDIRRNSKTFGKGMNLILNDKNNLQLLVPKGFAHGFLVVSNSATVIYQVDNYYNPSYEYGINALDPKLNIDLNFKNIIRSNRDINFPKLENIANYKF